MAWPRRSPDEVLNHRMELQINADVHHRLRVAAAQQGVSASELLRQLVADALDALEARQGD